ncbi:putative heat shock transcription factor Hsf1 [Talaromyces proteolyticus]|uniref:Heat shock transcription factor Hsf1 n=1 Tax=Talaromyces proteolyticus TaxID=1131652 RepID=A0AAD4KRW8_9EURO|nr:putative heat shock transcription factor Hsf1 [Talaromyces proteolyticus]KAH8697796.1 putative heat shock transcription factor Hsf1 [Talaromyces proteolyticus]
MASQSVSSRKRPAPGTSPAIHAPMGTIPNYTDPNTQLSDDQFLQWGQDAPAVTPAYPVDSAGYNAMPFTANQDIASAGVTQSNQIARRPMNQLINRNRTYEQTTPPLTDQNTGDGWGESVAELEQRALVAKREAQAKRKQIPPFVQKLRSFLDESKNTELIRWSDDGDSFIVLDEDEFARTLIPELFKHNNYASFVRQLNMYGFHKKVGLSDNSMRASERKNKSPSEYANPYFKRGYPDLLWLIQKPKNVSGQTSKGSSKGAKARTDDGDENDVEEYVDESNREERSRNRAQLAISTREDFLPKDQLSGVYRELQTIRQQQQIISSTISKLRREHEQLYGQAANFQEQHNRHENSINAILTFLATVYNRSLQGHESQQNIANSFPQDQGNVVDVGDDFVLSSLGDDTPLGPGAFKKKPLLLKAPPQVGSGTVDRATTLSPAASTYDGHGGRASSRQQRASTGIIEEVPDGNSPQPPVPTGSSFDQRKPQRDIMSMIQNSNAVNGIPTDFSDFPNIVSSLETSGGNSALTPKQRADALRQIAHQTNVNDPTSASSNNALISPSPPPMLQNYSAQLNNTRNEIDNLMKMQAEQDRSVQNLTNLLQPLSPTGQIPGLADGHVPPPSLDLDQIFNSQDYFTDLNDLNDSKDNIQFSDMSNAAASEQNPGATADVKDLFNFDNLGDGGGADSELFGDTGRAGGAAPTSYFDNYEDYHKDNAFNNNFLDTNTTNLSNNDTHEPGRIVETLTDSEATSPANTVDENAQGLGVPATGAIPESSSTHSPKRRRKA